MSTTFKMRHSLHPAEIQEAPTSRTSFRRCEPGATRSNRTSMPRRWSTITTNTTRRTSIDHISAVTLAVRDMAESVTFYQKLGLDVSYGGPDALFTTMRVGQSVINLRQAPTSAGNPWGRVILHWPYW